MTIEQVKQAWKEKGEEAAKTGTRMHKYIELFFNGMEDTTVDGIDAEILMFKNWLCALDKKYCPFRTEYVIYDEELGIAGTIDMLFKMEGNHVAIFDWKRSKEIKYRNKYERANSPLTHLEDCNYNHYCLQLNLYKYLLEKNYNFIVTEMYLIIIHCNQSEVQMIPVPLMEREIKAMLSV